ncbi:MAG: sugar phosphate isomerase/epimerase [Ruminococcaceae bacterium]|nr:sugar phosphate isomerase/epimerase [Oscillospiraceae bacterium]
MKIATTTGDYKLGCKNDIERIRELHRAGFRYIDLNMYCFTPDCDYMKDSWRDAVAELKNEADRLGIAFVQAHSQGGNPIKQNDEERVKFILDATIRSIEICALLGIKNTVAHPGMRKGIGKDEWFELNREFYKKLFPVMEATGVNVLTENSTAVNMGDKYFANTGKDMRDFLEFVGHPQLHACWDTGHGNCEGFSQYEQITTLGDHLYAIHYNDNQGEKDQHVMPYFGTLNHDEIINALIDINYKGYFTLECDSSLVPSNYWLYDRREFERDTRLAEPPLFIRRKLEEINYETAKYILSQYGLFEE